MKYFTLTFDLEEFSLLDEYTKCSENEIIEISVMGLKNLLSLLEKYNINATFFTTYFFAKNRPHTVENLSKGHEISLHGYKHSDRYGNMKKNNVRSRLRGAKSGIENIINEKIYGFRAPRMETVNKDILDDLGFSYDSSLHPTWVPSRYNNFFSRKKPFIEDNIVELPISVTSLFRLPFSWFWFRNLGLSYARICTGLSNVSPLNIYFHPWEFVDLNDYDIPFSFKDRTGEKMFEMFDKYLGWCKKKEFKFLTIKDFLKVLK